MSKFTGEQLQQQWSFSQMTPEQKQEYRIRLAQRASQLQNEQPQGQQQQHLRREQFNRLSPEQQQHVRRQWQWRQQQNAQQRPNSIRSPVQSLDNTHLPGSHGMAPRSSPSRSGNSSQPQATPHSSPVLTVSSTSRLLGANILMTGNGQQERHHAASSSSISGTSIPTPYAPGPLSASSPTPPLTLTTSPQDGTIARTTANASSSTPHRTSPTLSANSHMLTLPLSTAQTQSESLSQQRQQAQASNGATQSQQPRMPPSSAARSQQSSPKQGNPHAQSKQQFSPTQKGSSPFAGQKRQATDAPEGTKPVDKRPNLLPNLLPRPRALANANLVPQNASPSHQPGAHHRVIGVPNGVRNDVASTTKDASWEHREQQAKLEAGRHRTQEHQARAAEEARIAEQYHVAYAAALQREKDDKRKEELRKDPSANFRHILEVYKLMPLKKGELPNRYLMGLLANRSMPMDLDSNLALAITFAKDHWDYYGQWPTDIERFAGYERERRAKYQA